MLMEKYQIFKKEIVHAVKNITCLGITKMDKE